MIRPVHADLFPQDLQAMLLPTNTLAKRRVAMVDDRLVQQPVNRPCKWKLKSYKGALVMSICVLACLAVRQWEDSLLKQIGCEREL